MRHWTGKSSFLGFVALLRVQALGVLGVTMLFLAGCRTLPPLEPRSPWDILPPEAALYAYLSVPLHREILSDLLQKEGFPSSGVSYLLDHTTYFYLAGMVSENTPSRFQWVILGEGDFSSFLLQLGLSPEKGWTRKTHRTLTGRISIPYFEQDSGHIQVALLEKRLLIFSNGNIQNTLDRAFAPIQTKSKSIPLPLDEDVGIYLSSPFEQFFQLDFPDLEPYLPTLESIRINLTQADPEQYLANGVLTFQKVEQARSVSVLLRLTVAKIVLQEDSLEEVTSMQISVSGTSILFSGIPIPSSTVVRFLTSMIHTSLRMQTVW